MTRKIEVEVRRHHRYPATHWIGIVTTPKGYCFFCTWAGGRPSEATVRRAWTEDKAAFSPYRT